MFELREKDGLARTGTLITPRGSVKTPALMPVLNPNISLIPASAMKKFGCEMVITNSYIFRNSGISRDVHEVLGFDGPVMTDSGTFQSHVYGSIDASNEEMLSFQERIGSDIATIVDEFVEPEDDYKKARAKTLRTISAARIGYETHKGLLALPVQGGKYNSLRRLCARSYYDYPSVFPIGGVVPLMESQRYHELIDVILTCKRYLNPSMPVHLFGCGHPMLFAVASLFGCDLFDSAAYSKFAAEDKMMFENGTYPLEFIEEDICDCPACSHYGLDGIKALGSRERSTVIAEHNLYASFQEIMRVRNAIENGRIWELAELRARGHPSLLAGLGAMKRHRDLLEHYEPLSRKSSLGTGIESFQRPAITRAIYRSADCAVSGIFLDSFIPCPVELRYTYPFGQTIMPYKKKIRGIKTQKKGTAGDVEMVRSIARMQFGAEAEALLFDGNISFVKSRNNSRIRNVMRGGQHILSLRAEDGFFTLKIEGAKILHALPYPRMRVIVNRDSEEPVKSGKNVFAKFVVEADEKTIAGNEVIVVSEDDELLAVGRALMVREEMLTFKRGMAIKVREGMV
jgi:7-cyano-7-deazaguanine tRNA-ribosyltransferase